MRYVWKHNLPNEYYNYSYFYDIQFVSILNNNTTYQKKLIGHQGDPFCITLQD